MTINIWSDIAKGVAERLGGAFRIRFIIQPIAAIALGIRDGLRDAKAGEPPYVFGVVFSRERRRDLLASGIKDIIKPVIIGIIVDAIFQYVVFQRIRVIPAVIVGSLVIGIPYALSRGVTNRIATLRRRMNQRSRPPSE